MIAPLFVGVGGAAGAVCRHLVSERVETATRDTLIVNTFESLLLGAVVAAPAGDAAAPALGSVIVGGWLAGAL